MTDEENTTPHQHIENMKNSKILKLWIYGKKNHNFEKYLIQEISNITIYFYVIHIISLRRFKFSKIRKSEIFSRSRNISLSIEFTIFWK